MLAVHICTNIKAANKVVIFSSLKGSKGIGNRFDEQRLTLRIHRGRGNNFESTHSNGGRIYLIQDLPYFTFIIERTFLYTSFYHFHI